MPTIEAGASTLSSSISLVKTIIGAGLMSMPLAFSTDGFVFGFVIILVAAATSGFGLFLQAYVSRYVPPGHATFFNLCSITYPKLSVVFDIAIAIQCFGCSLSYLVLIGDLMPTIISVSFIAPENYNTFWTLASAVICVPLSFLKNLDSLKYTSVLGLVAIGYLSLLVIFHALVGDVPHHLKGNITIGPPTLSGVFSTFSIIVFAFTGHQNMFSIINEAKDKSIVSLTKLINFAVALSAVLFATVGLAGYLTFGDKVNGNVILLYPSNWTTTLGRFAIVFMVVFSFPLMIHPARISVNNIYYSIKLHFSNRNKSSSPEETTGLLTHHQTDAEEFGEAPKSDTHVVPFSNTTFNVITILLLVSGYYLAVTVKSFAFVLAIVGATGSTAISFILPGLFGYKLISSESDDPTILEKTFKSLSLALVIWGFIVMFLCLFVTLTS